LLKEIKRTDIVQPCGVVFVLMREDYGIQLTDSFPQHLLTKVRACINHKVMAVYRQVYRNPQPFVAVV
jgi:hypothetical protein